MNQQSPIIRAMQDDDLPNLILIHKEVFSRTVGTSIGDNYLLAFLRWFTLYPYAINLVYIIDNRLVGYVFGASAGYGYALNRELFWPMLLGILTHPCVAFRYRFLRQIPGRIINLLGRAANAQLNQSPSASNLAYKLVGIGVTSGERGHGIGRQIIGAFEAAVWERGGDEIRLTVYRDNLAARRLYERQGWQVANEGREVIEYITRRPHQI